MGNHRIVNKISTNKTKNGLSAKKWRTDLNFMGKMLYTRRKNYSLWKIGCLFSKVQT